MSAVNVDLDYIHTHYEQMSNYWYKIFYAPLENTGFYEDVCFARLYNTLGNTETTGIKYILTIPYLSNAEKVVYEIDTNALITDLADIFSGIFDMYITTIEPLSTFGVLIVNEKLPRVHATSYYYPYYLLFCMVRCFSGEFCYLWSKKINTLPKLLTYFSEQYQWGGHGWNDDISGAVHTTLFKSFLDHYLTVLEYWFKNSSNYKKLMESPQRNVRQTSIFRILDAEYAKEKSQCG